MDEPADKNFQRLERREQNRRIYSFANFQLDAGNRQLRRDDKSLPLPPKAFDLLLSLVENNGRLVGKDELFTSVWRGQIVEESNLTVYISQIRKALGESKDNPRFIETVPGYSYRFLGEVSNLPDEREMIIETETLTRITIEKEETGDPQIRRPADAEIEPGAWNLELGTDPDHRPKTKNQKTSFSTLFWSGSLILAFLLAGGFVFRYYSSKPNNQARPAVIPFTDAKIKQLTTKGKVGYAVLSPDGKFYAYTVLERGEYKNSLWLGQTDGSREIELRPPDENLVRGRAFSPDGKTLYFASNRPQQSSGSFYKMPVLGGLAEKLSDSFGSYFTLSPDGKFIACSYKPDVKAPAQLAIVSIEGGAPLKLFDVPNSTNFNQSLRWTPDGKAVCYRDSGNGIWRQAVEGGAPQRLKGLPEEKIYNFDWSRDGKFFAFTRGREISDAVLIQDSG